MKEEEIKNETNNNDLQNEIEETLEQLSQLTEDDNADVEEIKRNIKKLRDGTEVLSGEFTEEEVVDDEPEMTMKQKKAIYRFVNNISKHKEISDELIEELTDEEFNRMMKIGDIKLRQLTYFPKKKFNKAYKKKRQHKNKLAKASRKINAKK